uniref:Opsin n=1 Tax=Exaiptasia diaphana TaxID=2652724 RepID=A0A346FTZ6_EXADI|nr:opsin [Exaiptasia diaphana]
MNKTLAFNGSRKDFWTDEDYHLYRPIMFIILGIGFIGNVLTIIVFLLKQNRCKVITPFFINLAIANLFITVFGYPVAINVNLTRERLLEGTVACTWYGFVNGSVGIASIVMLTEISVVMWYNMTSLFVLDNIPLKYKVALLTCPWLYGILVMTPPLFGWNRFIPGSSGISCCPDWRSNDQRTLIYNILLVILGFLLPLVVICISYIKIYRFFSREISNNNFSQDKRRQSQIRVTRVIVASIVAFVVSWSPYCVISLAAMFSHRHVLKPGEAEIPDLLAKSSVIYNPIIYTLLSRQFRENLTSILFKRCRRKNYVTKG